VNRILFVLALVVLAGCTKPRAAAPPPVASASSSGVQEIQLAVTDQGFEPAELAVAKDRPIRLTVTRKTDQTCAREIIFKEIAVKKDLPLGQAVAIDLPARPAGTLHFACGMDMVRGSLVVQ